MVDTCTIQDFDIIDYYQGVANDRGGRQLTPVTEDVDYQPSCEMGSGTQTTSKGYFTSEGAVSHNFVFRNTLPWISRVGL